MTLILSRDPTGDVLSWQMSVERAAKCASGHKYTAEFKTYGGNTAKVVFILKGTSRKELKKARKWRINSAQVQDETLYLALTKIEKTEQVDILQIVGRPDADMKKTIVSFLTPSEVHAGNGRPGWHHAPKMSQPEAVSG